jgi:zinc/manganese transport system permease protein
MWGISLAPFFDYVFMQRALLGGLLLSLSAAPLGVFLVLRRLSLTGDAMAHALLPGAALAYALVGFSLSAMALGGLIAGLLVALGASLVSRLTALKEDASLAAFYVISLALGLVLVAQQAGHLDLLHLLFGSLLALDDQALVALALVTSLSLLTLAAGFRLLVADCLHPSWLKRQGPLGFITSSAFLMVVVMNLVGAFHAMGTLMAVGLMILPAVSARFWQQTLVGLLLLASCLAVAGCFLGLLWAFHSNLPAGPCVILVLGGFYGVSLCVGSCGSLCAQARLQRQPQHLDQ